MRIDKINTGAAPNDGGGDTLRDAFAKTNRNFERIADGLARLEATPPAAVAPHLHEDHVLRIVAEGAPDAAPPSLGALWVDVASGAVFIAAGTQDVRDWRRLLVAD